MPKRVLIIGGSGQRAYYSVRFLRQHGYDAAKLSGGYATYRAFAAADAIG